MPEVVPLTFLLMRSVLFEPGPLSPYRISHVGHEPVRVVLLIFFPIRVGSQETDPPGPLVFSLAPFVARLTLPREI